MHSATQSRARYKNSNVGKSTQHSDQKVREIVRSISSQSVVFHTRGEEGRPLLALHPACKRDYYGRVTFLVEATRPAKMLDAVQSHRKLDDAGRTKRLQKPIRGLPEDCVGAVAVSLAGNAEPVQN